MPASSRTTFRPAQYGSVVAGGRQPDKPRGFSRFGNRVFVKGGKDVFKIDVAELDRLLADLRQNADVPIKNLSGELGNKFKELLSYVSMLYESSSYSTLYDLVKKHFRDLKSFQVGTIGAYCAGCHVQTSLSSSHPGCAPICAGSMPPEDDNWEFCRNTVILASYENNRFSFTMLKVGHSKEDKQVAYIFVNYSNVNAFPGFTDAEKSQLKKLGIERIMLNGYKENGREYIELMSDQVDIDDCKDRISVTSVPKW